MITKTAKRILLALCTALAAVCVLFAISFKPTPAKASTTASGLTEVTMNRVSASAGVASNVEYLEFDGLSGDTYFLVEFDGKNVPNFAFNAVSGLSTWAGEDQATAGVFMTFSREQSETGTRLCVGVKTLSQWKTFPSSYGLANFNDSKHYVMIVGFDYSSRTFYNYIYTLDENNALTYVFSFEEYVGVSWGQGSKAVIYPHIDGSTESKETVSAESITFQYATPQASLSALVNSLSDECVYKEELSGKLGVFGQQVTWDKVYATAGVAEGVDYLEFDGLSGDTWFMLEFTGQSIPNFALNAKNAYSTWNNEGYSNAGIFATFSQENDWGRFKATSSLKTDSSAGVWVSMAGSSSMPLGIANFNNSTKYVLIFGFDKDSGVETATKETLHYYLYSVDENGTLTKVVGQKLQHTNGDTEFALPDAGGSKAVIYPHIRNNSNPGYDTYSPQITFSYITPQQSLSELVNSVNEHHAYRAQLETLLAEEAVYNYSTQTLNISSNSSHTVTDKTAEAISFNGFDGDTYMLVDFVGRNAPNFAFNATTVYSDFSLAGAKTADAGNMIWNAWGNLKFTKGHGGGGAEYFNQSTDTADGVQGFGQARFVAGTKYVVIGAYDKEDSGITMTYYIFTVATDGTVTEARPSVSTTDSRMPEATGDKAVIYPYIGAGLSSTKTTFNLVNPADTMQGLLANIPDTCAYKQSLSDYFTSSYTVTVQNEKGEEITTASVKDGDTYTLPTSDIANFVAWEIDGKLYKAGTAITVTGDVTVKAVCFDFALEDGASIRISSTTEYHGGLRFTVKANTAQLTSLGATVYGFVLPTDSISGELDKTDATNATELENSVTDGDYTVYYITLTNVLYSNYNRAFSAMAYVELTLADETTMTVQTAYDAEKNSRCLYDIAVDAYNDTAEYSKYTSDQKKVVTDYINSTVNLIKIDDDTYQVATVEDGLTAEYVRGYTVVTNYDDANERLVFTITITIDSKLISTSDDLPHVPVTVWASDGNGGYVAERMSVTVQSYTNGVATLFFR
ncbi:MAG: hypothetical protein IJZ32_01060 [Clostridia bacterium]|nr:hypothetical protein [Clostridia bacterium]